MAVGILAIEVERGKDLKGMDSSGLSDPYVKIKHEGLRGGKFISDVQHKSLNPKWSSARCEVSISQLPTTVWIEVWDEDKFMSHDFIGRGEVRVDTPSFSFCDWVQLQSKSPGAKKKDLGSILVSCRFKGNDVPERPTYSVPGPGPKKELSGRRTLPATFSKRDGPSQLTIVDKMTEEGLPFSEFEAFLARVDASQFYVMDDMGDSPLHFACLKCEKYSAHLLALLQYPGIDMNFKNKSQATPLHYFCSKWHDEKLVKKYLDSFIKAGANINACNVSGETPIMKAVGNKHVRNILVSKLLKRGADHDAVTSRGDTILHFAAREGNSELLRLILRYSSDLNVRGAEGRTAIDLAQLSAAEKGPSPEWDDVITTLKNTQALFEFLEENGLMELRSFFVTKKHVFTLALLLSMHESQSLDSIFKLKLGQRVQLISALQKHKASLPPAPVKRSLEDQLALARAEESSSSDDEAVADFVNSLQEKDSGMVMGGDMLERKETLGKGAFGAVWKCDMFPHGPGKKKIPVAVKVLFKMEGEEFEAFKREFTLLSKMDHPNVVRLIGVALEPELGMVMEYCAQGSLSHVMNREGLAINWPRFFNIASDSLCGIQALHDFTPQILHRDIKSLNLLVSHSFQVKVADFGLARLNDTLASASLKQMEGTLSYMAPEVVEGEKYTTKSDGYSLAIIFWEMATRVVLGKHKQPYTDTEHKGMHLVFHVAKGLRPEFEPRTPATIKSFIQAFWETKPTDRISLPEADAELKLIVREYKDQQDIWDQTSFDKDSSILLQDAKSAHQSRTPKRSKRNKKAKSVTKQESGSSTSTTTSTALTLGATTSTGKPLSSLAPSHKLVSPSPRSRPNFHRAGIAPAMSDESLDSNDGNHNHNHYHTHTNTEKSSDKGLRASKRDGKSRRDKINDKGGGVEKIEEEDEGDKVPRSAKKTRSTSHSRKTSKDEHA